MGLTCASLQWLRSATRLLRSPYGRALRAQRDDEQVAKPGRQARLAMKLKTFFVGSALSGLAALSMRTDRCSLHRMASCHWLTIYIFLAATAALYASAGPPSRGRSWCGAVGVDSIRRATIPGLGVFRWPLCANS